MSLIFSRLSYWLLFAAALGCSQSRITEPLSNRPLANAWPKDWSTHVGQQLTLEGTAANAKVGAELLGDGNSIWIDGLDAWPEGYYQGGDKGKRVLVTGTIIVRHDLPVFIQKPALVPQGIPVAEGSDLHEASKRYLLKNATWEIVE